MVSHGQPRTMIGLGWPLLTKPNGDSHYKPHKIITQKINSKKPNYY